MVWSSNPGECKVIKNLGELGHGVRVRGFYRVRDRDRVRAGGERVILFRKHPCPKKVEKSLTSVKNKIT